MRALTISCTSWVTGESSKLVTQGLDKLAKGHVRVEDVDDLEPGITPPLEVEADDRRLAHSDTSVMTINPFRFSIP